MHFLYVVLGAIAGGYAGRSSSEFFGVLAGAVVASLLHRLATTRSQIDELRQRLDNFEQKQASAIPAQTRESPLEPTISSLDADVQRAAPEPEVQDKPIVHERVPETVPDPGPFSHAVDVAKRWLTSGNVPVKVGVLISFIGVGFLLKYAVENAVLNIPIGVRYLGVAAFATVLLGLGWRMRTSQRVYALSLQGGGIGVLFLTVFAAFQIHSLLPPALAFVVLVLVTLAAGVLAVSQESRALAILGTTGGFLAPLLVSTGSGNHIALFSYYLVLNGAVLGVAWLRAWRELNIIGFVFTFGVGALWGYRYYEPEMFASTELFLVLHFLLYTAIAILFALRQPPNLRGVVDASLVFGTPTIAFALQTKMLQHSKPSLAASAAVVAVFYAALATWLRKTQADNLKLLAAAFVALAVAFATIAIPLAIDDRWTAIAWALEGAALVWIGVRQQTTLARLTGAALSVLAGAMFMRFGWVDDLGIPLLNGNYLGGTLIAVSAIASSRLLGDVQSQESWARWLSIGLLGWGLVWWFGIGHFEILDRAPLRLKLHFMLLFHCGSFAACAFMGKKMAWTALQRATFVFLLSLPLFFLAYLLEHDHLFERLGAVAWLLAVVVHLYVLHARDDKAGSAESLWHTAGAVFFVSIFAYEIYWQVDRQLLNDVWPYSAAVIALAIAAWAFAKEPDRIAWPVRDHYPAYCVAALILGAGSLSFMLLASVNDPGDPMPMAYMPILNPFDVAMVTGLLASWYAIRMGRKHPNLRMGRSKTPETLWGASAFALTTLSVVRAVHHLADIPWDSQALFASVVVQTSLTIFWAALGLTGMILGTRTSSRGTWMLGVALMVIVVGKLAVVDLGGTGTLARIVSFLGVGIMLLVVGYYSPVPPRTEDATDT